VIGKGGGVDRAEVHDAWKEVVEYFEVWWWGNSLSIDAVCNLFSFEYPYMSCLMSRIVATG